MASPSLLRTAARPDAYVCTRCAFCASRTARHTSRRWIAMTKYGKKVQDAQDAWDAQIPLFESGHRKTMMKVLEERGLIHQMTGDRERNERIMTNKRVGAYVGIDPTASSLHVGHLLPLMPLIWMYAHGYHVVTLLGGATARIGDPTGRLVSREREASAIRTSNMVNMHYQLKKLWSNIDIYVRKYGYEREWAWHRELVNNSMWMSKLSIMDFLQMLGPGMRLGPMLGRDTVKNKLEKGDGMSFAEFTYPLLQGWDWWHVYNTKDVQIQIGGSDQYGNLLAGLDAVKYISKNHTDPVVRAEKEGEEHEPFGFTVPLLTTPSGEKIGKSAGNAIWLDSEKTSPSELYGYFMRQPDSGIERYLKLFTLIPTEEITGIMKEHELNPAQRKAHHVLARDFVELVHGPDEARAAEAQHRMLFKKSSALPESPTLPPPKAHHDFQPTLNHSLPRANIQLPASLIHTKPIGRILHAAGLATSASDGHRAAASGAIYIGGNSGRKEAMGEGELKFTPVKNWAIEDTQKFLVGGKLLVLRKGKHNIRIVEVVSDEEWAKSGRKYPGVEWESAAQKKEESGSAE